MASPKYHYQEAERLLDEANHIGHSDADKADRYLKAAHINALLANVSNIWAFREESK